MKAGEEEGIDAVRVGLLVDAEQWVPPRAGQHGGGQRGRASGTGTPPRGQTPGEAFAENGDLHTAQSRNLGLVQFDIRLISSNSEPDD